MHAVTIGVLAAKGKRKIVPPEPIINDTFTGGYNDVPLSLHEDISVFYGQDLEELLPPKNITEYFVSALYPNLLEDNLIISGSSFVNLSLNEINTDSFKTNGAVLLDGTLNETIVYKETTLTNDSFKTNGAVLMDSLLNETIVYKETTLTNDSFKTNGAVLLDGTLIETIQYIDTTLNADTFKTNGAQLLNGTLI